ncbi:class I SAM-dependent methyltransferase [Candidatus Micrarchaeota archaeon]|nr:class I SAM-dependent methyltransferase [Candidatus Micrarchaeota archaeon]
MVEKVTNSTEKRLRNILKDRELYGDYGKKLLLMEGEKKPPFETVVNAIPFFKEHGVKKIIDIGCGIGRHSLLFAREGFDATAFDLSKVALEAVEKRAREEKLENVHTLQGDAWKIPAQDGAFDAALSFRVLDAPFYTTEDRKEAIKEMARVLKPGGDALVVLALPKKELDELLETFKDAKLQVTSVALPAEIFVDFWVIKAKKE